MKITAAMVRERGGVFNIEQVDLTDPRGVIQGDSVPQTFIPVLADHIMAGRFPVERMITFYDLADINRAAAESSTGKTIKPVLRMPH